MVLKEIAIVLTFRLHNRQYNAGGVEGDYRNEKSTTSPAGRYAEFESNSRILLMSI